MRQSKWEVMPGFGARNIETISQDVLKWNKLAPVLDSFYPIAEGLGDRAASATGPVIDSVEDRGNLEDLDAMIEGLEPKQRDEIVRAYLAERALRRMARIRNGTGFGYGKRARLTVNENGVTSWRAFYEPIRNTDARGRKREVKPGAVIEGKISQFSSLPRAGGRLVLRHALFSVIEGLVDPSDGQPRVELDILATN